MPRLGPPRTTLIIAVAAWLTLPTAALAQTATAPAPSAPPLPGPSLAAPTAAPATPPRGVPALTLEQIMSDPDWIARSPERPFWSDDSASVFYTRKRLGEERRDTIRVNAATGQTHTLAPDELPDMDVRSGAYSKNRALKVYSRAGDLYLKDLNTGRVQQLTRTGDFESSPRFLLGDYRLAFQRGSQTYVRDMSSGFEYQVADVRAEKKPEDPDKKSDKDDFLRAQQERLFDIVKKNKANRDTARAQDKLEREADRARSPRPWYLGDDRDIREQSLAPTGDALIVRLGKKGQKDGKADAMPAYVTDDGYVSTRGVRSKVGTSTRSGDELVFLDLKNRPWTDPADARKTEPASPTPATPAIPADPATPAVPATPVPPPPTGDDGVFKLDLSILPNISDDPLKDLQEKTKAAREAVNAAKSAPASPPTTTPDPSKPAPSTPDATSTNPPKPADDPASKKADKPKPRPVTVTSIDWNEDGTRALLQIFSHDNKDRWIALVDADTKALIPLEHFHDEAWINTGFARLGWLRDNHTFWFVSEESGYAQVYFRDVIDQSRWPLQPRRPGDQPFEVVDVDLNLNGDAMYIVASLPGRPGVREAYRALIGPAQFEQRRTFARQGSEIGFPVQQLTEFGGQNQFWASPDDRLGLVMHSSALRPPELFVIPLLTPQAITRSQARQLTDTVTSEFTSMSWVAPEVLPIAGRDGRLIWSRVYDTSPPDARAGARTPPASVPQPATAGRPAVIFIHGAGYLQNAHEGWSQYFREFMFHSLLARRGYVVLDMDFRASAGYGRDWRTAIYRQMGTPELDDLEDGVAYLVNQRGVDRNRIGCYGGSYGGFLTLMAMFTRPDLFSCGAALRPVTDWAHYNDGYTANILNTPATDPDSFTRCSPIEYADGLRGHLLICHGMLDDNVLFQDTVRLTQRLIELKKENWEVAMYPIEPHAFKEPTSWLDEYRRIDKLFRTHLEAGARASDAGK